MKFYVPDHRESAEDAYEITDVICLNPKHDRHTAEKIAEYGHSGNHSWWECSWPMVIILRDDSGKESMWEVQRDMVPEFWAKELHGSTHEKTIQEGRRG